MLSLILNNYFVKDVLVPQLVKPNNTDYRPTENVNILVSRILCTTYVMKRCSLATAMTAPGDVLRISGDSQSEQCSRGGNRAYQPLRGHVTRCSSHGTYTPVLCA